MNDLKRALDEVSVSSAGGAPFLIAFGATLLACGIAGFFVPTKTMAIVVLFQGNVALPLAFWLERRMAWGPMAADNPLRSLSILMAMSQLVALPVALLAFNLHPATVPAAMAAIGGAHFLPYAWLHRTPLYSILGVAISIGAFALTLMLKKDALPYVLIYMTALYWITAPLLVRHARRVVQASPSRDAEARA
jgi:hypothetical protein